MSITNSITMRTWNRPLGKTCQQCQQPFLDGDVVYVHDREKIKHVFHQSCLHLDSTHPACPVCQRLFTRINDEIIPGQEAADWQFQLFAKYMLAIPENDAAVLQKVKEMERQQIVYYMEQYANYLERRSYLKERIRESVENLSKQELSQLSLDLCYRMIVASIEWGSIGLFSKFIKLYPLDEEKVQDLMITINCFAPPYRDEFLQALSSVPQQR